MKSSKVVSLNISQNKGESKIAVPQVSVVSSGIEGDAHQSSWGHRQISLMFQESIESWNRTHGVNIRPGDFAENITLDGAFQILRPFDRIKFQKVELEISQRGKKCHGDGCAIFKQVGKCAMPKDGYFARIVTPGEILQGERVEIYPRQFKAGIITLSDRAAEGIYPDTSGKVIYDRLSAYITESWQREVIIDKQLIADEPTQLQQLLQEMQKSQYDFIFTTGGTGIGPRDFTPEVVHSFADKTIPAIMDYIRFKYTNQKQNPHILLSRSVAAVKDKTLIFSLPGSERAVAEYLDEILPILDHSLLMLHGLGH